MNNIELVNKAKEVLNFKTFYIWGSFGAPITQKLLDEKFKQYPSYYTQKKKEEAIKHVGKGYFGFDCIGLIKGILWGWDGSQTANGGAKYNSNGVQDVNADTTISLCSDVSTNMSNIIPGECVWMKGHIGIYIGNGEVIESTPAWNSGVQLRKLSDRKWLRHGKLPWVQYLNIETKERPLLKRNSKNKEAVLELQRKLKELGYKIQDDGIFGEETEKVVIQFQKDKGLEDDGIVGKDTYGKLF